MFGFGSNPAKAYGNVGVETGVSQADPHKLILMLFDGALLSVSSAQIHMQKGHVTEKCHSISKAMEIITMGLKVSLDPEAGGDLAEKLGALYDYMCSRLVWANAHNNEAALVEVHGLLTELRGAWAEIRPQVVGQG